jgi:hypothetical protein
MIKFYLTKIALNSFDQLQIIFVGLTLDPFVRESSLILRFLSNVSELIIP